MENSVRLRPGVTQHLRNRAVDRFASSFVETELDGGRFLPASLRPENGSWKGGTMSIEVLSRRFDEMGARLRCTGPVWRGVPTIDVSRNTFVLGFPGGRSVGVDVVDARRRHLLLLVRDGRAKSKFLCGHDERQWFVAAVPESAHWVSGVGDAMAALRPQLVEDVVRREWSKPRRRRRAESFVRQGEWFFVPAEIEPPRLSILRNEPLVRGAGSTPHMLEEAYRRGGELVYVNWKGDVMSAERYESRSREQRRNDRRSPMVREPELYARGAVRHPDHATIVLRGWHRVVMNTKQSARAMQHVVFLD